ncbi:MAG: ABC transporter ATP-binding protein [Clostridia bacterium]|nr:ABC transporter ATP-binding protein [Clostridia bacterium]
MSLVVLELIQPRILGIAVDECISKYEALSADGLTRAEIKALRWADIQKVLGLGGIYLGTVVLAMGLTYAQAVILTTTGQRIIYGLRNDLFTHLSRLHMGFFNENPIGRLVTRVSNDCDTVNEMFTSVIVNILKSSCVLIGVMVMMMTYSVKLALWIFAVIPFITVATFVFRSITRKIYRAIRARISDMNGFVAERVSGMKVVQAFCAEEDQNGDFRERSEDLRKWNIRRLCAFAIYSPVSYVMNIAALAILILVGGKMAIEGVVTIGTLVVFQRYINKFFQPVQELAEQFDIIQAANACSERIFWLLDTKPEIENDPEAISMPAFRGEIEFDHVWFAYKNEEWVLKDVSFQVKPGERVAFVGATGAGKTTIQNLICRYYDVQKGTIRIDGVDIRKIRLEDLRSNVGQMLQDVFLFSGNVRDNIRLNNREITDEQIQSAAKTVNAHGFIEQLPDGYDHRVIERGAAFSAGQRQLLSFARVLAFAPSVLILDEATANIDTDTEALIQDALAKLMEGRTTIIVAHRLSTIQSCDRIIVMHKGQIMEEGDHQTLLNQGGIYYKLYKLQYEHDAA